MSVYGGPKINDSGLVLALDAGNTKSYPGSGATWTDLSGNSNSGTLVNSPTYSSTNGGILTFNGTNQYGSTPLSLGGYTTFTLSAWVNTTVSHREIMATYGITSIFEFWIGSNKLSCYVYGATVAYRVSNISITTGSWFHCVGVYQGSNGTLNTYINGVLDNGALTGTVPAALSSGTSTAVIGNVNVGSYYFNGSMGPVKIYNTALTAAQVLQNYNALRGRFGL